MKRLLRMLAMLARENLGSAELLRKPEDCLVMDGESNVAAWHELGADDGPIAPVYHFNALACSRLAPPGSTVVDLACGSGRFAAYLARLRPDLRVLGLDMSAPMVATGNASLRALGLAERVELRQGDMTAFADVMPADTSVVNCLFALHHLPTLNEVGQCLREIAQASERTGCGFMLLDLARPRHERTALDYPKVFTPNAARAFQLDSTHSLIAAYSHAEMRGALERVFGRGAFAASRSRWLPLYQAFWRAGAGRVKRPVNEGEVPRAAVQLPAWARSQYRGLRMILPEVPQ